MQRPFEDLWNEVARLSPFPVPAGLGIALATYRDELVHWNEKINLAGFRDDRELAVRHFLDSLAGIRLLPDGARAADVGSGAGFPGMVIALARPDVRMTCVESQGKKANFLRQVRRVLKLDNVEIVQAKAEELAGAGFDAVLGRAVAKPPAFIELARLLVRDGGVVLLWITARDAARIGAEYAVRAEEYILPGEEEKRCVATVRLGTVG